ncbi:MAG: RHS repeat-associated core domain-containing protein [Chitinispirillaceae bacterium]|nr:RHS repeat-associated core domain-containing protein [Chitinispirillaceae bacterium]
MIIGDPPDDGDVYTLMGVPGEAMINNASSDITVPYDFTLKYPFFTQYSSIEITYPAGSLENPSVSPALVMANKPRPAVPDINDVNVPGYRQVGNYMTMEGNHIAGGKTVKIGMPLFSQSIPSPASRRIAWYSLDDNEWKLADQMISSDGAVYGLVGENANMAIVEAEQSSFTGYLDNGMTYSTKATEDVVIVETGIVLTDATITQNGTVTISYDTYDNQTDQWVSATPITYNILPWSINETIQLPIMIGKGRFEKPVKIKITQIQVQLPADDINDIDYSQYDVNPGQTLYIGVNNTVSNFKSATVAGDRISVFYGAGALLFESLAFGEGVIKKNVEGSWLYHYYLKDHLGSTRMVVADDGNLVDAMMYHPYGKMEPVVDGTESVRERFTGKELDQDGENLTYSSNGMDLQYFGARYYDPETGVWTSVDPEKQFWNSYGYCGNSPVLLIDPNGKIVPQLIIGAIAYGIFQGSYEAKMYYEEKGYKGGDLYLGMLKGAALGGVAGFVGGIAAQTLWVSLPTEPINMHTTENLFKVRGIGQGVSNFGRSVFFHEFINNDFEMRMNLGVGEMNFSKCQWTWNDPFDKDKNTLEKLAAIGAWWSLSQYAIYEPFMYLSGEARSLLRWGHFSFQRSIYEVLSDEIMKDVAPTTWYGNFLGPGNKALDPRLVEIGPKPVDQWADGPAFPHDVSYIRYGTDRGGPFNALYCYNPHLIAADARLTGSFAVGFLIGGSRLGYTQNYWPALAATSIGTLFFGSFTIAKTGMLLNDFAPYYSNFNY